MSIVHHPISKYLQSQLPSDQKQGELAANPGNQSLHIDLKQLGGGIIVEGTVQSAGPDSYNVILSETSGPKQAISCAFIGNHGSSMFGTSEAFLPVEGAKVIVYLPNKNAPNGWILGSLPNTSQSLAVAGANYEGEPTPIVKNQLDLEGSANSATEPAFRDIRTSNKKVHCQDSNSGRPVDLFAGNFAQLNELGIGLSIQNLLATLRGSENARIDVSPIDDIVRVVSGHWWHLSAIGDKSIANDGGFLTEESGTAMYQCERAGYSDYATPLTTEVDLVTSLRALSTNHPLTIPDIAAKYRAQLYSGYLGDILNLFVYSPDPNQNPETNSAHSLHRGLAHFHVDSSGRTTVRTAAGFTIQRWDHIPVPKRLRASWDPEGTKVEDLEPTGAKEPFAIPTDEPRARALHLRDAMAWRNKLSLQRINELSVAAGRKDFYVPEERDLPTPEDEHDKLGKAKENFAANSLREAVVTVEEDGSIILRDAGGASIILDGNGKIIIEAPAGIELRSGKDVVALAGNDLVLKAKNHAEITSTDADVRVKAERNIHMLAEGRQGSAGILIENKSTSRKNKIAAGMPGESVETSGIVLKSATDVLVHGDRTFVTADRIIAIDGFGTGDKPQADLMISANRIVANARQNILLGVRENATLYVADNVAALAANTALLVGGQGAGVFEGDKLHIPLTKADVQFALYPSIQPGMEQVSKKLAASKWLDPFLPKVRKALTFKYRANYDVDKVYQPFWAYLKKQGGLQHVAGTLTKWTDHQIDGNYAYPGAKLYKGDFKVLEAEVNISVPSSGIPVVRKDLKNTPKALSSKSFNEYEVLV